MITILNKNNIPEDRHLIGKYALFDSGFHFYSLGGAKVITSISGARVYVDEEKSAYSAELKRFVFTPGSERKPHGYVLKKTIAAICDTPEEVNMILGQAAKSFEEFIQFKKDAKNKYLNLNSAVTQPNK